MTLNLTPVKDVEEGLILEAGLFSDTGQGVHLWQSAKPALVCPRTYRKRDGFQEAIENSAARGWPVLMRPSGGGTVPLWPGVLNMVMALTVPQSFGILNGYQMLCEPIIRLGDELGLHLEPGATPDSYCDGDWNLSFEGRKIVGTAQRLRPLRQGRVRLLGHALILVDGDVEPGALAVDAFHRDLGLDPIRADVHMTLRDAANGSLPDLNKIAGVLQREALMSIQKRFES